MPGSNFNYIKTFAEDDGEVLTLALDAAGELWKEDVTSNPGVLEPYLSTILPGSYAKSVTQLDEEWMVFSDLRAGTDIPRHGSNLDRISQVGPGAGPAIAGSSAGSNVFDIVASPDGLTQPAAASDPGDPGHFQAVNWSSGPVNRSPGNVLTIFYSRQDTYPQDANIVVGGAIYISGLSGAFSGLDGTYIVQSVGVSTTPGGSAAVQRWYFTVQVPTIGNIFVGGPDTEAGTYQVTLATMTLTAPAAINIGDSVTLAGVTNAAWGGTYTILNTLNGAQIAITSTSLTGNVATYNYTLISGVAPTAGEQVSITGCTNGPIVNGTSIFNVSNYAIETAGAGTFTISLNAANVSSAAETGNGIVNGTIFTFDPGLSLVGTATDPIFGNSGGGTATTTGQLGSGVRKAVTIFQTRNGYVTAPSPPVVFETTGSTNTLQVSQIAIGPPNVIVRIVAFTGANGGFFFYIPVPVTIQGTGQPQTFTATVINDNVTTQAVFRFTDAVLLAGTPIDVQGNDLFNEVELGSAAWSIAYAGRMFYGLENNKIQNLLNPTFDGGYLPNDNGISAPLGWTVDPVTGGGGQVVPSPIFGNSYQIANSTGSTQAILGLITQSAFQDAYQVPIILPNFAFSIRVRASSPSGAASGTLVIDLYSPSLARQFGSFTLNLASLTTSVGLYTGTFLTSAFTTQVPSDLQLRVYAAAIPDATSVLVDRIELFPTKQPVLTTEVQGSYVDNPEAFDGVTGVLGVGEQNNQPVLGAFINYDILYLLKSGSMFSTQDSPSNEPGQWTIREVSNKIGTCGVNAYDYGEEWMVTACRQGLYLFDGGEPRKISQEIQPTWDAINWLYGDSIWVRNDILNRRILIGVPMATPNTFLPNAAENANPTSPNVILMLNYKELNTANELGERGPVKISYSGKLISWDLSRKWSIWQIPCPYADFITRADGTAPLFFCNGVGNSKIYQQMAGLLTDDGNAIDSLYTTYGFVKESEEQQAPQLGAHRKLYKYLDMNLSGNGPCGITALPNVLNPAHPYQVPNITLQDPAQNNVERPINQTANRLFLQFRSNTVNSGFALSSVTVSAVKDPHAPVRGLG